MKRKARLSWDYNWYTPSNLKALLENKKESQVRKEYSRLRDIAQKRLKRLEEAGFSETEVYKKNISHYPTLKEIKTKSELAQRLSDLSRFIKSSQTTVQGIKERRQKVLESLSEHGYGFVNESNLNEFGDFMESYRANMLDMEYDSGDAAELYSVSIKHKIDPEDLKKDFEYYLDNLEELKKLRRSKKRTGSAKELKKALDKKIKEKRTKGRKYKSRAKGKK